MERLTELLIVGGGLYLIYFFTLRRWDYDSEAKRNALKARLKQMGLSNAYHFTGARKLFLFIFLSGGAYAPYWTYKQWSAVLKGYQNSAREPLKGGPIIRAAGCLITFFQLAGIAGRTCIYLRKTPPGPAWLLGVLWLGAAGALFYFPVWWQKLTALAVFAAVPAYLQHRLNALPGVPVPNAPKRGEIITAAAALAAELSLWAAWRALTQ